MDTKEIIEKYYEYVNDGNWDKWLTLFDDDVEIDEQLAGHVKGLSTLRGAIGGLKKGYSKFKNNPKHIVIDGHEACVVSHIVAANAKGVPIDARVANYFRIRHGKIVYMANFHDTRPFDPFMHQ